MEDALTVSDPREHVFRPALPPPADSGESPVAWARTRLFSSPSSTCLTILIALTGLWAAYRLMTFALINAVWSGDGGACRAHPDGACWAFIAAKRDYLLFGAYPTSNTWRVELAELLGALLIGCLAWRRAPHRNIAVALFFTLYPAVAFVLLYGAPWIGLQVVETIQWGGLLITLLMSLVGIVFSLPLGIVLALGRRSELPVMRALSVAYIETVRGVPFIAVLFMANFMMPLFVPDYLIPDRLLRPMIGTALFSAAYMAEVVRAGLQALPKGQTEGAQALGVGYLTTMRLVILPQALTAVIPGIVSTFIGLFKDTTLVAVVGIADFLQAVETARIDPEWAGPTIPFTGYLFAALIYWGFCFGMSRYSMSVERHAAR